MVITQATALRLVIGRSSGGTTVSTVLEAGTLRVPPAETSASRFAFSFSDVSARHKWKPFNNDIADPKSAVIT